jgi:cbb3-type cytochrome oxidase maturation protein
MDILYLLIPLSLVFVAVIAAVFLWAVKSGQFEDMEGPAHRILMDDEFESPDSTQKSLTSAAPEDASPR